MRVDNQPYGRLNEIIYDQAFTTHPYKHPTIGSMEDLEAASIEDVRDFYQTYYVPANATLVVVGDFDTAQAMQLVDAVLRPRAEGRARPVPRDIPQEPPQTAGAARRRSRSRGRCRRWSWRTTSPTTAIPDSYPLHIASKVLSDGQSSRIYQKLVYEKQMAVAAFGGANLIEDPNLFYASRSCSPGTRRKRPIGRAHRRARSPEGRADHRPRAAAGQEPVRARLHPRPRIEPAEGAAAGARGRHSPRHHDGRRRVRHLPEHHGRRRAARGADLLHAGEPAGAHDPAVERAGGARWTDEDAWSLARRCSLAALVSAPARGAGRRRGPPRGRRGRCRRATSSSRRTRSGRCRTACRSSPCCTTSSRSSACG